MIGPNISGFCKRALNMPPIRVQVALALRAVAGGQSLDAALAALDGDERDLSFARALVYQSVRHHYSASALVARLCQRAPKPAIAALLRAALTELRFLATPPHAAVAESVAAARAIEAGAAAFVNALLRRFLREREALEAAIAHDDEARLEHPRWLIEHYRRDWPGEVDALCAAGNQPGPMLKTITDRYNEQMSPYYAAARLWVDAIIDPMDTREWISMGIEMANHSPIDKKFNVGVIQT